VNAAIHITNVSPSRSNSGVTLAGRFFQEPPKVDHLWVWGCLAYVYVDQKSWTKLNPKCIKGILVGYDSHTKGYRVYIKELRIIKISIDVKFGES
jgi:hypothetical protein